VAFLLGSTVALTLAMGWALGRCRPPPPRPFVLDGDEREFTVLADGGGCSGGCSGDCGGCSGGCTGSTGCGGCRGAKKQRGEVQLAAGAVGEGVEEAAGAAIAAVGGATAAGQEGPAKVKSGCGGGGCGKQGGGRGQKEKQADGKAALEFEKVAGAGEGPLALPKPPQITLVWEVRPLHKQ
jgi:hypothetical protein